MKAFEEFAFDPKLPLSGVHSAVGLDKLKYVKDRGQAKALFDLWHSIHEPRVQARVSRVHQERRREEQLDVARKAHAGKLGDDEFDLAQEVFGLTFNELVTSEQLRAFWYGLSALRQARANRVTGDE